MERQIVKQQYLNSHAPQDGGSHVADENQYQSI